MPGMSGSQLTEKLREFNVNTPILFCSGAAQQKDKDEARLAGAQGYLVKPVGMDDLIAEVVRLIKEARVA
jgi:DNA-binding response OmpR family regulator